MPWYCLCLSSPNHWLAVKTGVQHCGLPTSRIETHIFERLRLLPRCAFRVICLGIACAFRRHWLAVKPASSIAAFPPVASQRTSLRGSAFSLGVRFV